MKITSHPVLSIICPIRNMEGKLQNLESWLSQITKQIEVILVYDESSDDTFDNITQLISRNSKAHQISILSGKYGAPGLARNAGLNVARGSWICFWDSDDIGFPTVVIETLEGRELKNSPELYCFGYEVVKSNSQLKRWPGWENSEILNFEMMTLNPGLWRFCFSRKIAFNTEFSRLRMGEDQLYLAQIGLEKLSIEYNNKIAYRYFKNVHGQLTSSKTAIQDLKVSLEILLKEQRQVAGRSDFIEMLLIRQSITAIKNPNVKLKAQGLKVLTLQLFQNPSFFVKFIINIARSRKVE